MKPPFSIGQRWINLARSELGLGLVVATDHRTVTLSYPACGESLSYICDNAPLGRARFSPGDRLTSEQGETLQVESVAEQDGLLIYQGRGENGEILWLPESRISALVQFSTPRQRLLSGQSDSPDWFALRRRTLKHRQRLHSSPLTGLGGARTELLPHQLYIANELSRRPAPRALLADEVGLGKTIEACLILHRRQLTGLTRRTLILAPEPLLHQWLVELIRRFNLRFSLLDEMRCREIEGSGVADNPFLSEQNVLCATTLISNNPRRLKQALEAGWDLLIVDEAHHLEWHPETGGSTQYLAVEALARQTEGVLLLTATPEQLGHSGHFARLRLLDPERYPDLEHYRQQESHYAGIASLAARLLSGEALSDEQLQQLDRILPDQGALIHSLSDDREQTRRQQLIDLLLDRHGPGRILFRNSRHTIRGFPERHLHGWPLPLPEPYALWQENDPDSRLYPELSYRSHPGTPWWRFDPRVQWLIRHLRRNPDEKLLLICAHRETASDLERALREREGIHAGLFHERMTLVERDRAAAWFADPEQGCRLLICSEIGSEGRNFQFVHQLVLFDLPRDPDLLEQRIGRLDRIGQKSAIDIHVPYFEQTPQETLLRWYHEGLDSFRHTCAVGHELMRQMSPLLEQALDEGQPEQITLLIESSQRLRQQLEEQLQQGRDRLLELNSCRQPQADRLRDTLIESLQTHPLDDYLLHLLECHGVEVEHHSDQTVILRPAPRMESEEFPELPEDGLTGTFDRRIALSHEHWHFLTWEHPLVTGAMEMLLAGERGNSCICALKLPGLAAGQMLLELLQVGGVLARCLSPICRARLGGRG